MKGENNRSADAVILVLHRTVHKICFVGTARSRDDIQTFGQGLVSCRDVKNTGSDAGVVIRSFHETTGHGVPAFRKAGDGGGEIPSENAFANIILGASGGALHGSPGRGAAMGEITAESYFLIAGRA